MSTDRLGEIFEEKAEGDSLSFESFQKLVDEHHLLTFSSQVPPLPPTLHHL